MPNQFLQTLTMSIFLYQTYLSGVQVIEPEELSIMFHKDQISGKNQKEIWNIASQPLEIFLMIKR